MSANTRKQLNIRNDEAFATAHDLAAKLGMTTTEIVVSALREFKSKRRISDKLLPPEEAEANLSALMESVRRNASKRPAKLSPNMKTLRRIRLAEMIGFDFPHWSRAVNARQPRRFGVTAAP
jgi:hypothetical protein